MAELIDRFAVDDYRRKWVENRVKSNLGDDPPRYSELARLIDNASSEAAEQAIEAGYSPDQKVDRYEQTHFDKHLSEAVEPIENLRWCFPNAGEDADGRVWSHRPFLLSDVRGKLLPEFSRYEIEQAAGAYIKGRVKTPTVDRLFVDLLIALEFAQFADSQINAPHIPVLAPSVLKRKPIVEWFLNRIVAAVLGLVGYSIFWGLSVIGVFPEDWLWLVGLILVGLFLLEAAWAAIVLPKFWLTVRKVQRNVGEVLNQMSGTYAALASDGPISAQHVKGLVDRSTEAGVVWPAPLHVLLEDITARGGRF